MRLIVSLITVFILGGCSKSFVVNYPFPDPRQIGERGKLVVQPFTHNARPMVASAYIIDNKENIIGVFNKGKNEIIIRSNNRIDELLQQVLVAEFKHAGYTVEKEITLAGRINSFSASFIRSEENYLLANIQVYLKVQQNGEILYENHYLAGNTLEVSDPPDGGDFVKVMGNGLVRLVQKIINDKSLLAVLAG